MSFWDGIGSTALGMLGGVFGANSQHRRQKELMSIQHQNQQQLNQQGHDLQMEMWKNTSYPAQLEMMKKAGLSPGLMYGGGAGAGGSTGSQGGGSAAGGSAASFQPMDMNNMLIMEQIRKMKEETNDLISQRNKRDGVDTDLAKASIDKVYAEFSKILSDTENVEAHTRILEIEQSIKRIEAEYKPQEYEASIKKMSNEARKIMADAQLTEESKGKILSNLTADYWLKQSESQKNWSLKYLSDEQIKKIEADIDVAYSNVNIGWADIDVKKKQLILEDMRQDLMKELKEMDLDFAKRKLNFRS